MAGDSDKRQLRAEPADELARTAHEARLLQAGRLLASVIHEIKNPLAAAEGYVQLLLARSRDASDQADLEAILKETRRMASLIDDMLSFSRRGSDQATTFDLCATVASALNLARHDMCRAGISVVAPLPQDPVLVRASPGICVQVLLNLLDNARHSLESSRQAERGICMCLEAAGEDRVHLVVSNNGPPIPRENAESIFDPFFTTKAEGVGTGLGLALCRDLLARFDAAITLDPSGDALGASFRLDFPRA